jgi:hypothetical protein
MSGSPLDNLFDTWKPEEEGSSAVLPDDFSGIDGTEDGFNPGLDEIDANESPVNKPAPAPGHALNYEDMTRQLLEQNKVLIESAKQNSAWVDAARRQAEAPSPVAIDPLSSSYYSDEDDLSDDEKQVVADTPILMRVAKAAIKEYDRMRVSKLVERVQDVDVRVSRADSDIATQQYHSLLGQVKAALGSDFETKKNHPDWKDFSNTQVPHHAKGVTFGALIDSHARNIDADGIVEVYKAFNPASLAAAPNKKNISIPSAQAGTQVPTRLGAKKTMDTAEFSKRVSEHSAQAGITAEKRKHVKAIIDDYWAAATSKHGL